MDGAPGFLALLDERLRASIGHANMRINLYAQRLSHNALQVADNGWSTASPWRI
jgi:hypothetical protein